MGRDGKECLSLSSPATRVLNGFGRALRATLNYQQSPCTASDRLTEMFTEGAAKLAIYCFYINQLLLWLASCKVRPPWSGISWSLKATRWKKKKDVCEQWFSSDLLIPLSQWEIKLSSLQHAVQIFDLKANITIFIMQEKQLVNLIVYLHSHMLLCKVFSYDSVETVINQRMLNHSQGQFCMKQALQFLNMTKHS